MGAAAGAMVLAASLGSCTANPTTKQLLPNPAFAGKSNGPQFAEAILNCSTTIYYNADGEITEETPNGPREVQYYGGLEPRTWAGATEVILGYVYNYDGRTEDETFHRRIWVVQSHTPSPADLRYAVGEVSEEAVDREKLPPGWDELPKRKDAKLYVADKKGHPIQVIPNNILAGGAKIVTREAPYIVHELNGTEHDLTEYDMVAVTCEDKYYSKNLAPDVKHVDPQQFQYPAQQPAHHN